MNLALRRLGTLTYRASLMTGVALVLPTLSVRAGESANERPELVIIEGQRPQAYKPPQLPSLGKLTEPLIDTPQTINVVTEQLLKDRAATNLTDALRTVPGISIGAGEFRSLGNTPTIRGFVARTDIFMDGMRDFGSYYRGSVQLRRDRSPPRAVIRAVRTGLHGWCHQSGQQVTDDEQLRDRHGDRRHRLHSTWGD
jgi:catecholate siderophore receptor